MDEAVLYYYLVDLEENRPPAFSRAPGESDTIRWRGDLASDLSEHASDTPDAHQYKAPTMPMTVTKTDALARNLADTGIRFNPPTRRLLLEPPAPAVPILLLDN